MNVRKGSKTDIQSRLGSRARKPSLIPPAVSKAGYLLLAQVLTIRLLFPERE